MKNMAAIEKNKDGVRSAGRIRQLLGEPGNKTRGSHQSRSIRQQSKGDHNHSNCASLIKNADLQI